VAKREGILDLDMYNAPRNGNPFADESALAEDSIAEPATAQ